MWRGLTPFYLRSAKGGYMGMRRAVLLLASAALAVLLASEVALAFPLNEAEPNDSIAQAQNIDGYYGLDADPDIANATTVPHATVYGTGNDTYDYYSFTVTQAGVNTTGVFDIDGSNNADGSVLDSYLRLYDQGGNLLGQNDDSSGDPGSASSRDSYLQYDFQSAGTYYIAVGRCCVSPVSAASTYRLNVSTRGAVVSDTPPPEPPDATPPETILAEKPETFSDNANPSFGFRSNEANTTFECKLDGGSYQPCSSPKRYFLLPEGQHNFEVRGKDASGNVDQTPAQHTWTVDSLDPKVTFTERPGTATGPSRWDEWVTNDRTPAWAWTVNDANPGGSPRCDLYDETNDRDIMDYEACSSPFAFEGELPDGDYYFQVETRDEAYNYGYAYNEFEIDTVAPTVTSTSPTGRRVSRTADVVVTFDDQVHSSKQFVNIYKGSSSTPLAVSRYGDGSKKIGIDPKKSLRSGTQYTVKVTTGANDGANNLETPKTWSFKTK
jgi:hypothetical protein